MDKEKERSPVFQELSNLQLKISYLFLELMKEKNEHEQNSENLNKKVDNLLNEIENLKKENTDLKQSNEDMKCIIEKGITVFKSLDFSNISKEYKIPLDELQKSFFQFSEKMSEMIPDISLEEGKKCIYVNNTRCKLNYHEIQKEFEDLSDLNFFTNFSYNEVEENNLQKKDCILGRSCSGTVLKSLFQNTPDKLKISKEPSPDCENEIFPSKSVNTVVDVKICRLSPPLREVETCVNKSPVFKDFGVRRQDSICNDENGSSSSTSLSLKLFNEKFLEESDNLTLSPWKKCRQLNEKTPSKKSPTAKRPRKRLKINSPERSPVNLLKNSNMREAEISFSGIRKLRQTLLNIDCFKKKSSQTGENENCRDGTDSNKNENKVLVDEEDDDFITDSPKKGDQILEEVKIKKSELDLKIPFITPPQNSDTDLDETYISSSLVQKCYATSKREVERAIQKPTPLMREKTPEYCSVSFVYKREPVRKKVERMKLPGHACLDCMKYYENALGNVNTQDLKKILNKCSRHRDRNSPTFDDTPPGYWKPYLTCSTVISPNKDDVQKAVIN